MAKLYIFIIPFSIFLVFLLFYTFHKVRRIHIMLYDVQNALQHNVADNLFRQIEALLNLHLDLKIGMSLPSTRGWAASPDFLNMIARHALYAKPNNLLECGSGVSTLVLARCVQLNGAGHVYSLEHNPEHAEQTRNNLICAGLSEFATIIDAPLKHQKIDDDDYLWYDLGNLPSVPFEMLVVDGPPVDTCRMARYPAGPNLIPMLTDNALIFLDDASRDDDRNATELWVKAAVVERIPSYLVTEKGHCILKKINLPASN